MWRSIIIFLFAYVAIATHECVYRLLHLAEVTPQRVDAQRGLGEVGRRTAREELDQVHQIVKSVVDRGSCE